MRRNIVFRALFAWVLLFVPLHGACEEGNVPLAAAQEWLSLVDKGQYVQSWEAASALFRTRVGREQWAAQAAAVRLSLGDLVSREMKSSQFQSTLPGAPDGEYYVITYSSAFAKKARAVETLVIAHDKGEWKASGYFIM